MDLNKIERIGQFITRDGLTVSVIKTADTSGTPCYAVAWKDESNPESRWEESDTYWYTARDMGDFVWSMVGYNATCSADSRFSRDGSMLVMATIDGKVWASNAIWSGLNRLPSYHAEFARVYKNLRITADGGAAYMASIASLVGD